MPGFSRVESARVAHIRSRRSPSLWVGHLLLAGSRQAPCLRGPLRFLASWSRAPFLGAALLFLAGCGGLKFPLDEPLSKKSFEPRHEPAQIELFYSTSRVAKTVSTGGSHTVPGDDYAPPLVDSGTEEVARSFPIPGASRRQPEAPYVELRKLRTNLVLREAAEPVPAGRWPDEPPQQVLPSKEMIDDGLGQLQEMAAEAGADAVRDVFAWVLVEEARFGVAGVYEFQVIPRGVVLQGIAIRYKDP